MNKLLRKLTGGLAMFVLVGAMGIFASPPAIADTTIGPFSFSQTSMDFYYTIGGGFPTDQHLTFTNLTNNVVYYKISVPNQPAWLNASYTETELPSHPGSPTGLGGLANVTGLSVGDYRTTLYLTGNFASSPISIPINLHILPAGTAPPAPVGHPDGTNILTPDGTVYRIVMGSREPYTSAGAFLSYSYNKWEDVKIANAADLALLTGTCSSTSVASRPCYITPRYGSLINDNGTVYLITDNHRIGFASAQVFLGLGYSFSNVTPGDTSFLETLAPMNTHHISHPSGTAINIDGTICVIQSIFQSGGQAGYRCLSDLKHFYAWGYRLSEVVMANVEDRKLPMTGVIDYSPGPHSPMNL